MNIPHLRLYNQCISATPFSEPQHLVAYLGAVQAQDYAAAKWAVGLRLKEPSESAIDHALNSGDIIRTHVLRPTWHFVAPQDLRWMLELTAPRVKVAISSYLRKLSVDAATLAHSNSVIGGSLEGGNELTRLELAAALEQAGIDTSHVLRLTYLVMWAELDGVICSGAPRGKQFTYALLSERVPQAARLDHDEALAKLAVRYFTGHGPATLQDFVWWSGLATAEAKAGIESAQSLLAQTLINGKTYWFSEVVAPAQHEAPPDRAYLLPNYDEYTVAYKDRSIIFDPVHTEKLVAHGNVLSNNVIVLDGRAMGVWRRTIRHDAVTIEAKLFTSITETQSRAIKDAAERYGQFAGRPVKLRIEA